MRHARLFLVAALLLVTGLAVSRVSCQKADLIMGG